MDIKTLDTPLSWDEQKAFIEALGYYTVCDNPDLKPGLMELADQTADDTWPVIATGLTPGKLIAWHIRTAQNKALQEGKNSKAAEVRKAMQTLMNI